VRGRLTIGVLAVFTAALAVATSAAAENYQFKIVAKDAATATHVVLQRSDLGGLTGWTGGKVAPDRTPETEKDRCNGYLPKQSDLVVTGDAATTFRLAGAAVIHTEVSLLQTPAMVATDWQRTVAHPGFLGCLRQSAQRELGKSDHVISVTKLPYSKWGTKSAAFRVLFNTTTNGKTLRVALDEVAFYRGRTEVAVIISGGVPTSSDLLVLKTLDLRVADAVLAKTPAS
jgi:hypothetical protein